MASRAVQSLRTGTIPARAAAWAPAPARRPVAAPTSRSAAPRRRFVETGSPSRNRRRCGSARRGSDVIRVVGDHPPPVIIRREPIVDHAHNLPKPADDLARNDRCRAEVVDRVAEQLHVAEVRARRFRRTLGRGRDPLPRRLCRALLGPPARQDHADRRAYLLPLARRLGFDRRF